jgi:hypothetical protein
VHEIGREVLEAHANSDVSMMAMMQKLETPLPALPTVVLNVIDLPDTVDWALSGLTVATVELDRDGKFSPIGIYIYVHVSVEGVNVRLGYNTALFNVSTGRRLTLLFREAIDMVIASPTSGIGPWLAVRRG